MSGKYSIGIIGAGFVGTAICKSFQHYVDVKIYDKFKHMGFTYPSVVAQDILFICLPTPMKQDGSVDLSVLDNALRDLSTEVGEDTKIVIIKSTVPPEVCRELAHKFRNLRIFFSPEFLTERTAELDFIQQSRIIIGVPDDSEGAEERQIEGMFKTRFPYVPLVFVGWDEASLIKYFTNVFFCTKIALFNEFAQIAEKLGLDPNQVAGEVLNDGRIGRSHWQVPGHDGRRGFGGSCFPKDINGYMKFAREYGILPTVAQAAWEKNLEVRPEKDWEKLKGRAVS